MLATPMVLSRVLDTSIDIDAPPQRVWDVLLDLRAWQEWNPFIPFISEEFGDFGTLQLSGDSYANLDTYTITESVSEHDAHPGA